MPWHEPAYSEQAAATSKQYPSLENSRNPKVMSLRLQNAFRLEGA